MITMTMNSNQRVFFLSFLLFLVAVLPKGVLAVVENKLIISPTMLPQWPTVEDGTAFDCTINGADSTISETISSRTTEAFLSMGYDPNDFTVGDFAPHTWCPAYGCYSTHHKCLQYCSLTLLSTPKALVQTSNALNITVLNTMQERMIDDLRALLEPDTRISDNPFRCLGLKYKYMISLSMSLME